jgi:outer membrane protein TolC
MKMFASYNQLKAIRDQSIENLKSQVQQSVSKIMTAYFTVWFQKRLLNLQYISDSISSERLKIAQQRFTVGLGSKLEYLQAQVDHNADRSALMKQQVALNTAKRLLNQTLSRVANIELDVSEDLPPPFLIRWIP